LRLLTGLRW